MHRNTAVFIAFLAVVAGLLAWTHFRNTSGSGKLTPAPTISVAVSPTPPPRAYQSDICNVSLTYPGNLKLVESTDSGTAFIDTAHPDRSVVLGCTPSLPPFDADTATKTAIRYASGSATVSATLYHIEATSGATPQDTLLFRNPKNGLRVFLIGFGDMFRQILATVRIQ